VDRSQGSGVKIFAELHLLILKTYFMMPSTLTEGATAKIDREALMGERHLLSRFHLPAVRLDAIHINEEDKLFSIFYSH